MPLDLLYLYAVFYINTFHNLNDSKFKNRCDELEKILGEIDDIWKIDGEKHKYNDPKNKDKLQKILLSFFGLKEKAEKIPSELKNIVDQSFNDSFVSLKKYSKKQT